MSGYEKSPDYGGPEPGWRDPSTWFGIAFAFVLPLLVFAWLWWTG